MKQFSYVLTNQDALHTRPMSSLMQEAARFSSKVRLKNGAKSALLAQVRDVMGLGYAVRQQSDRHCGGKRRRSGRCGDSELFCGSPVSNDLRSTHIFAEKSSTRETPSFLYYRFGLGRPNVMNSHSSRPL